MRNTTILLFITLLLFTVCIENVKADNKSPVDKEQKNDLVEGIFKLADDILEFAGNILTPGNKEKGNSSDKSVVTNKFDIIEGLHGLVKDAVNFSWEIITLGYDNEDQNYYQEWPTHQQWENVEAASCLMFIAECLANSAVGAGF